MRSGGAGRGWTPTGPAGSPGPGPSEPEPQRALRALLEAREQLAGEVDAGEGWLRHIQRGLTTSREQLAHVEREITRRRVVEERGFDPAWRDWGNQHGLGLPARVVAAIARGVGAEAQRHRRACLAREGYSAAVQRKMEEDGGALGLYPFARVCTFWWQAQRGLGAGLRATTADVVRRGRVELLQWALEDGCPTERGGPAAAGAEALGLGGLAAASGHRELLQFLHDRCGVPLDGATLRHAAMGGQLGVVEWLLGERRVPADDAEVAAFAGGGGSVAVLRCLRAHGGPWDASCCAYAAVSGHLGALQWAVENGCPWDAETVACAAEGGDRSLATLQWAVEAGCPWDARATQRAVRHRHLAALKWLRAQGCPWSERTRQQARRRLGYVEPGDTCDEDSNEDFCSACMHPGNLVCCDTCPRAYHYECARWGPEDDAVGEDELWSCPACREERALRAEAGEAEPRARAPGECGACRKPGAGFSCTTCPRKYHAECFGAPIAELKAGGQWQCSRCLEAERLWAELQAAEGPASVPVPASEEEEDLNDDECGVCGKPGDLACCDGCPRAFHPKCIRMTTLELQADSWLCPKCRPRGASRKPAIPATAEAGAKPGPKPRPAPSKVLKVSAAEAAAGEIAIVCGEGGARRKATLVWGPEVAWAEHVRLPSGELMSLGAFEKHAGRGSSGKWKQSIRVRGPHGQSGVTLGEWLQAQGEGFAARHFPPRNRKPPSPKVPQPPAAKKRKPQPPKKGAPRPKVPQPPAAKRRKPEGEAARAKPSATDSSGQIPIVCEDQGQRSEAVLVWGPEVAWEEHVRLPSGELMSLPEFEKHAGRGATAKWKQSIRVRGPHGQSGVMLGEWLETHGLTGLFRKSSDRKRRHGTGS